jgi:hypothetical protein
MAVQPLQLREARALQPRSTWCTWCSARQPNRLRCCSAGVDQASSNSTASWPQ